MVWYISSCSLNVYFKHGRIRPNPLKPRLAKGGSLAMAQSNHSIEQKFKLCMNLGLERHNLLKVRLFGCAQFGFSCVHYVVARWHRTYKNFFEQADQGYKNWRIEIRQFMTIDYQPPARSERAMTLLNESFLHLKRMHAISIVHICKNHVGRCRDLFFQILLGVGYCYLNAWCLRQHEILLSDLGNGLSQLHYVQYGFIKAMSLLIVEPASFPTQRAKSRSAIEHHGTAQPAFANPDSWQGNALRHRGIGASIL